jgi:hypothetical protein
MPLFIVRLFVDLLGFVSSVYRGNHDALDAIKNFRFGVANRLDGSLLLSVLNGTI